MKIKRLYSEQDTPDQYMRDPGINLGTVRSRLLREGYSDREINIVLDDLRNIPADTKEADEIIKWSRTGDTSNKEVLAYSKKHGLSIPAAYIELLSGVQRHYGRLRRVYIMVGLPGSGKSTWIKNNLPELSIISRDKVRESLGHPEKYLGDRNFEDRVTKICKSERENLLKSGEDFVIDDTNLNEKYLKELISELKLGGVQEIIGVIMKTPLSTCIERRQGEIDSNIIENLDKRFKSINFKNYFDKTMEITNNNVYRVKRFSQMTEEQREYGLIGNLVKAAVRPKHLWNHVKKGLGYGLVGGLIGGPVGWYLGSRLGAANSYANSYVEEAEKNGD